MPNCQHSTILPQPLSPGYLRICLHCQRWYALEFCREEPHPLAGKLRIYRCKYCNRDSTYATQHPRGAI